MMGVIMANKSNLKLNKWWGFASGVADRRQDYSFNEMTLRIIQLMELAEAEGRRQVLVDQSSTKYFK